MLRFHEIAERNAQLLCPVNIDRLVDLGEGLRIDSDTRMLDLACGKGELIARWSQRYDARGVGVESQEMFVEVAQDRLFELDVTDRVHIVASDVADYPQDHHEFDLVSCLGGTWIGGGLAGMLTLMARAVHPNGGLLVVGEAYWKERPPAAVIEQLGLGAANLVTMSEILNTFDVAGFPLVDMVIASQDDLDRYETGRWLAVHHFLAEEPDDPDAHALQEWRDRQQRDYIQFSRRFIGWGVFVLAVGSAERRQSGSGIRERAINPDQPVAVLIREGMLWVTLQDGRVIGNPVAWYPTLASAPGSVQEVVELTETRVTWSQIDLSIRVATLLNGGGAI